MNKLTLIFIICSIVASTIACATECSHISVEGGQTGLREPSLFGGSSEPETRPYTFSRDAGVVNGVETRLDVGPNAPMRGYVTPNQGNSPFCGWFASAGLMHAWNCSRSGVCNSSSTPSAFEGAFHSAVLGSTDYSGNSESFRSTSVRSALNHFINNGACRVSDNILDSGGSSREVHQMTQTLMSGIQTLRRAENISDSNDLYGGYISDEGTLRRAAQSSNRAQFYDHYVEDLPRSTRGRLDATVQMYRNLAQYSDSSFRKLSSAFTQQQFSQLQEMRNRLMRVQTNTERDNIAKNYIFSTNISQMQFEVLGLLDGIASDRRLGGVAARERILDYMVDGQPSVLSPTHSRRDLRAIYYRMTGIASCIMLRQSPLFRDQQSLISDADSIVRSLNSNRGSIESRFMYGLLSQGCNGQQRLQFDGLNRPNIEYQNWSDHRFNIPPEDDPNRMNAIHTANREMNRRIRAQISQNFLRRRPMPTLVGFCGPVLKDEEDGYGGGPAGIAMAESMYNHVPPQRRSSVCNSRYRHFALIIGSRMCGTQSSNGRSQQRMQYLIQNSWGGDCDPNASSMIDCESSTGRIWVDADTLISTTYQTATLTD